MKKEKIKIFGTILVLISLVWMEAVWAISATLYGEVTDDGGDPNLIVWFEWGKTTSYGNKTPEQTKYGKGEFSATISGLEYCTTYHYRAAARHANFNDTVYGGDKTFTTDCPVTVDLKVNSQQGPITIPYSERTINLSWTSNYAQTCEAETTQKPSSSSVSWSGTKSTSGSESLTLDKPGTYKFKLTCKNTTTGNTNSDSVEVNLQSPTLGVITKGVVITY